MLNKNTAKAVQILRDKKLIDETTNGILLVGDCLLAERHTGKSYSYTLYNFISGEKQYISHGKKPADDEALYRILPKLMEKEIVNSAMPKGEKLIRYIFEMVFSKYGYTVREDQIDLSIGMYKSMLNREIHMSDVAVGFGKTHAYLVAGIVYHLETKHRHQPIIVTTSSKELQSAIIYEYLPDISKMLLEYGVIDTEIKAALRKGKTNYICQEHLQHYLKRVKKDDRHSEQYNALHKIKKDKIIDLDNAVGISRYDKNRIQVKDGLCKECNNSCCLYQLFMKNVFKDNYIFQVCNHNYYTIDAKNKHLKRKALLPLYKAVIIDEAHKLEQAAIQTYSVNIDFQQVADYIKNRNIKTNNKRMITLNREIYDTSMQIEKALFDQVAFNQDTTKYSVVINSKIKSQLIHLGGCLISISKMSSNSGNYLLKKLVYTANNIAAFLETDNIAYIEKTDGRYVLVGVPKEIAMKIKRDLFNDNYSVVLTSGTMAVDGDFEYSKRLIGLNLTARRITYMVKKSSFDYMMNSLIYSSRKTIHPDYENKVYIQGIANEVIKLISSSYGHALVLFTSYTAMKLVYEIIRKRKYPFPIYKTNKGNGDAVRKFRSSENSVLLGCGAMWEGMNFVGDKLSHLIITKLPFLIPDPITEYKRTELCSFNEYSQQILIPQMLLKLKQGHGRAIRTEADTAVISILDYRVNGRYKEPVLNALPKCSVTSDVEQVKRFFREKKSGDYWRNINNDSIKFS